MKKKWKKEETRKFSKTELFESIRYSIYCHFFEFDPSDEEVLKDYEEFWKTGALEEHFGDCIKQPCPCLKCQADWINDDAKKAYETLWNKYPLF